MSWNYRFVREVRKNNNDEEFDVVTIREVFYDGEGKVQGWTEDPIAPSGEDWKECFEQLSIMGRVVNYPILDISGETPVDVPLLRKDRK